MNRSSLKVTIPSSKSNTMRSLLIAGFSQHSSIVKNPLFSSDTQSLLTIFKEIGIEFLVRDNAIEFSGFVSISSSHIDCGNSGIIYRFLTAILSTFPQKFTVTGDTSIVNNRPIEPLIKGLQQLGVTVSRDKGVLTIQGPWKSDYAIVDGKDSQTVSGLLFGATLSKNSLTLDVEDASEKPWIDVTMHYIHLLSPLSYNQKYELYVIFPASLHLREHSISGDISSASFFIALSCIRSQSIFLQNISLDDIQGDTTLISFFTKLGCRFVKEKNGVSCCPPSQYAGFTFDMRYSIDSIPILSVLALFASSQSSLTFISGAKVKESNRVEAIVMELTKLNGKIHEQDDTLVIEPSTLKEHPVCSHNDHRIAMSLAIAGSTLKTPPIIKNSECVRKTFPLFFEQLSKCIKQ